MYESHFQLNARPFPSAPRTDLYFPAATIEHAHHTLARLIERGEGPGLLIGGPGTGKSLVCQLLAERFGRDFHVVTLHSAHLNTRRALLQLILFELDLPYRGMDEGELRLSLIEFLARDMSERQGALLLVDEAHTLPPRLFEDLRLITNLARDGRPRVRIVLSGGPQLEERFALPELESFNQRLAARCYLQPLNYDETCAYVHAQFAKAGTRADGVLAPDAWRAIYHATDGIARLINLVCDHALLLAATAQRRTVDARVVEEAWADLQQLPAPWQSAATEASAEVGVVEFGELGDSPWRGESVVDCGEPPAPEEDLLDAAPLPELEASFDLPEPPTPLPSQAEPVGANGVCSPGAPSGTGQAAGVAPQRQAGGDLGCAAWANPFDERFDQEHVVVDRYASLQAIHAGDTPTILRQREIASAMQIIFESVPPASADPPATEGAAAPEPDRDEPAAPIECADTPLADAEASRQPAPQGGAKPQEANPLEDVEERVLQALSELALDSPLQATAMDEPILDPFEETEDDACIPLEREQLADESGRIQVLRHPPADDNDMIVVIDEDRGKTPLRSSGGISHRQEYRQLFSRLRQS